MEFINEFVYFVIKPFDGDKHLYCSGVNINRFSAITKGRHRLGQNPAVKGLQTLNNDIRALIISNNATPETLKNLSCQHVNPLKDELWYSESFIIYKYIEALGEQIKKFAPSELLKKIFRAMLLNETVPENLSSGEFVRYLYEVSKKLSTSL